MILAQEAKLYIYNFEIVYTISVLQSLRRAVGAQALSIGWRLACGRARAGSRRSSPPEARVGGGTGSPPSKYSWFQTALVEEWLVSKRPRGRIVGFKPPSPKNSWFQTALVEE